MEPPFPSPTPTWHNDVYPAIDPTRPNLSHAGQTVIITGAVSVLSFSPKSNEPLSIEVDVTCAGEQGSGIGRETAIAFAAADAKHIVLIGRSESTLTETQQLIPSSCKCSVFPADVTDQAGIEKVAQTVGTWDVLILNAGYISTPAPVVKASLDDYWKNYEVDFMQSR